MFSSDISPYVLPLTLKNRKGMVAEKSQYGIQLHINNIFGPFSPTLPLVTITQQLALIPLGISTLLSACQIVTPNRVY